MAAKIIISGLIALLLSSCTAGFRPSLNDYKGQDAARIRVGSEGNTALQFFEKQDSGCYKKVLERRITSGFAILGIPLTGNKRMGMPASSDNNGVFINEFTLKPGQMIRVFHYWTETGYYQNTQKSATAEFIPQVNHDYEIVVRGSEYAGDSVSIKNLTPDGAVVGWGDVKECPSKSIFD